MLKLVVSALMIAAASAALPALPALRQYPTRPPPTYSPLPAPTYTPQGQGRVYAILRFENDAAPDGSSYQYGYETENGISAQESGTLVGSGNNVAVAASGTFQYTSPEGVPVQINYVADENGFQPSGNVLPTPPPTQPIPAYILRSLEYNAAHPEPQQPTGALPGRNYYQ